MSHDTNTSNEKSAAVKKTSGILLHSFTAVLIGVGIVAIFATGLFVFNSRNVEKETPEVAYLIRFPENEDMLSRLPREIIEGTGFENIAPAGGDIAPAE